MTRLLTAEQVSERLQLPVSWVYAAARRGAMPYVRLGRYVRFRPDDVDAWVEQQRKGGNGARP